MKYNDYHIDECAKAAMDLIKEGCQINQKYTCEKCGERQTMEEPNKFFLTGKCEECGHITTITHCNYIVSGPGDVLMKHLFKK